MSKFNESDIDYKELTSDGQVIDFKSNLDIWDDNSDSEEEELCEQYSRYANLDLIHDEDTFDGEPFEKISKAMLDLIPDGKIKKRILREGTGERVPEYAFVTIEYNMYIKKRPDPIDSSYARRNPHKFTLNRGEVLIGLDLAVQSMKLNEKSQFLIHPDYGYKSSIVTRVSPNSELLLEVELIDVVDSGATITYESLPKEKRKQFNEIYKVALAGCEIGKYQFKKGVWKNAIREFNIASEKLDEVVLYDNQEDIKKHHDLKIKLYSNLIICYIKIEKYHKGCATAKAIYDLTRNGESQNIPAKVYFNHGKCLRMIADFDEATKKLKKAASLEPTNPEIANELTLLNQAIQEYQKNEADLAKKFLKTL